MEDLPSNIKNFIESMKKLGVIVEIKEVPDNSLKLGSNKIPINKDKTKKGVDVCMKHCEIQTYKDTVEDLDY